jgi:hypothetical protein
MVHSRSRPQDAVQRTLAGQPIDPMRSVLMGRVRGRDSKPEMVVRRLVHAEGYRFRLHRRDLPGTPESLAQLRAANAASAAFFYVAVKAFFLSAFCQILENR